MERIETWKVTAEIFLRKDVRTFIKDASGNFYFCDIILVGEDTLTIQCFGPEQRKNEKIILYWPLIIDLKEYKEGGK